MCIKEIDSTLNSFMTAGSDTSATMLRGTTAMLVKHPDELQKLIEEIWGTSQDQSELTLEQVKKLPYLSAIDHKSLRLYPPVSIGFPRVIPEGGDVITGHWVLAKVHLSQGAESGW